MRELWLHTKTGKGLSPPWTKIPLKLDAQDKASATLESVLREKTKPKKRCPSTTHMKQHSDLVARKAGSSEVLHASGINCNGQSQVHQQPHICKITDISTGAELRTSLAPPSSLDGKYHDCLKKQDPWSVSTTHLTAESILLEAIFEHMKDKEVTGNSQHSFTEVTLRPTNLTIF